MDILKTLLEAYYNDIPLQASLDYIDARYIIQQPNILPPDWSTPLPCVLIYPNNVNLEPDCMGHWSDKKLYNITLSIFKEYFDENVGVVGDSQTKGIIEVANDFETVYNRNNLSDTSIACLLTNINYQQLMLPQFAGLYQCHLTFQHLHVDSRS